MAAAMWAHAPDAVVLNGDVFDEGVWWEGVGGGGGVALGVGLPCRFLAHASRLLKRLGCVDLTGHHICRGMHTLTCLSYQGMHTSHIKPERQSNAAVVRIYIACILAAYRLYIGCM